MTFLVCGTESVTLAIWEAYVCVWKRGSKGLTQLDPGETYAECGWMEMLEVVWELHIRVVSVGGQDLAKA